MNARQVKKKLKNKIKILESDNYLMQQIIKDSPGMQELYDLYNKPVFVAHSSIEFEKYCNKKRLPDIYNTAIVTMCKNDIANSFYEVIKNNIHFEIEPDYDGHPVLNASIFIGKDRK